MTEFVIRPYQAGDEVSINAGFNTVFRQQRSMEEWQWKFQAARTGSCIMVAVDADQPEEIVAHFAVLPIRMQVNGRKLIAGQSVDDYCVRHADAVAQKVYLKTVHACYAACEESGDIPFFFGFPGKRHMRLGRLLLGFGEPITVPVWRRSASVRRRWWRRYRVENQVQPQAADALWRVAAARYPVSPVRDAAWLHARYLSRPQHKYIPVSVWRSGVIHAWAIAQVSGTTGQWVELVWNGQDERALIELQEAIAVAVSSHGGSQLEMWLSGDAAAAGVLSREGWVCGEHPEQLQMTTRIFDATLNGTEILRQVYLTMGDSDLA